MNQLDEVFCKQVHSSNESVADNVNRVTQY